MTQLEAWFCGMIWGALSRIDDPQWTIEAPGYRSNDPEARPELIVQGALSRIDDPQWTIEAPGYRSNDPEARAELIVQLPSGKALQIIVTEFDTEASRHRKAHTR